MLNGDTNNIEHFGKVTDVQILGPSLQNDLSNSSWDTTIFVHKQLFGSPLKLEKENPVQESERQEPYIQYNSGFQRSKNSVQEAKGQGPRFQDNRRLRKSERPVRETKRQNLYFRRTRGFRSSWNPNR